jgi:hypothetical protein
MAIIVAMAAFKDLNSKVKERVRKATDQDFGGADLVNRAVFVGFAGRSSY